MTISARRARVVEAPAKASPKKTSSGQTKETKEAPKKAQNAGRKDSKTLEQLMAEELQKYFENWQGEQDPFGVWRMLMRQVEPALITATMNHTQGNKSRTARILGINRGSLDSKLRLYRLEGKWRKSKK